jgi:transcriptional activator SPT8
VATSQVSDDDSENENENENGNDNENGMEDENENGNDNENGMENGEEQDNEGENENDGENEDEDVDMDAEGGEADQENGEQSASPSTQKSSDREPLSSPPRLRRRSPPALQPRADSCSSYDIVPCLAAPHATSVNAITATTDMRWVFTGGSDGYIRKFDHFAGMNGKVPLTVAQKHPFVDSVTKVKGRSSSDPI